MSAIIEVSHLTKKFPSLRNPQAIKEFIVNLPRASRSENGDTFSALKNVSLSVEKGECVGIIGKNGAGKSTLLSLLLGTSHPTEGTVTVHGKRTPLLELGSGFHPDLTGRENITLNAVLLGLTRKDVIARTPQIIEFSEIEAFIDMPVRTYSSGMYLRLAFSVAIYTDPEILLIDEILAVGDESFQKKSGDALVSLIRSGVTTVFVSHNLEAVKKICSRAIWLDHGQILDQGPPSEVIQKYLEGV
ncbi:MAG: ABC transporter ATP-binding protein [Elusimicrobia bacterium]|nr:ABC transporter ATP-binding protein [Elusimicrobiota bacterium]